MLFDCPLLERRRIVLPVTLDSTIMDPPLVTLALLEHTQMAQRVGRVSLASHALEHSRRLLGLLYHVLSHSYGRTL